MQKEFADLFDSVARLMAASATPPYLDAMARTVDVLDRAFRSGGMLLLFGNGGSSADAQHLAAELVGRFARARRALPAVALTTNQALLTAWSNDRAFEEVFARQVEALGRPGDVAWAISTSGASPNVLRGLGAARTAGLTTIGLTGRGTGEFRALCDIVLSVPHESTARVQEVHIVTYHAICDMLERRLPHA